MKIAITGYTGFVGSRLVDRGIMPVKFDVTNRDAVSDVLYVERPDVLIYAAGITNVDDCQKDYKRALEVNAFGVKNILEYFHGKLLYISSDHVFWGDKFFNKGYSEKHKPNPKNNYGISKLGGEAICNIGKDYRIIRTSKLFTNSMLKENIAMAESITTVLRRSFCHVEHFIDGLLYVLDNWEKMPTILNVAGDRVMSYYDFYLQAATTFGMDYNFQPRREYTDKGYTPRPKRGGLNVRKAQKLGVPIYSVQEGFELDD